MAQHLAIEEAIPRPRPPLRSGSNTDIDVQDPVYRAESQTWSVHLRIATALIAIDWQTASGATWKASTSPEAVVSYVNEAVREAAGDGGLIATEIAAIHSELDRLAGGLDEAARKNL